MINSKKLFRKIIIRIMTWQSRFVIWRYKPKIIAITGSVGKTSTKDAIFTVLSKFKTVRKSDKSYNSEFGIPLTILGCPNGWNNPVVWFENMLRGFKVILWAKYPEWLILEVGAGKPNDIKSIAKWLHPDIVVITRFPDKPVHVEFFKDAESIIEEKSALAFALKKNGTLILNHDDEKVYALHEKANRKTVSYGLHDNATYQAIYPSYKYAEAGELSVPDGINFKIKYEGNTFPVMLPHVLGMHYVGSALATIACAKEAGCDLLSSINAISEYMTPPGRLSLIEGINNSVIIDDTYNASPVAMSAAIETLKDIKGKRKIAVLGDMLELGKMTEEAHIEIGEQASNICDILVTVGLRARTIALGARGKKFAESKIKSFDNSLQAGEFLKDFIKEGDIVLLKGSQGIRLEKAVKIIMAHPEDAPKLLPRQEEEWLKR